MRTSAAPVDAWSRLWRAGVLHSCATGISGNYDGPIAAFWEESYSPLRDGERIVDIGTGNGALLLLAKAHANRRRMRFDLHGVDMADIDPPRSVRGGANVFEGIRFHPCTSADRLPFESGSVHLLTSQYAFEYMPADAVLGELVRILRTDGSAAFLLHSRDSLVCQVAAEQLEACRFLFGQSDVFERAREAVILMDGSSVPSNYTRLTADPRAETIRLAFNAAAQRLLDAATRWPRAELLRKAIQAISNALQRAPFDAAGALTGLDDTHASLRDEFNRLLQLDAAILDLTAIERLGARFRDAGFMNVVLSPLDQQAGARMGWTLVANRG